MENRTLNWLKGRLSYFKLVAIYLAILISLTFFVSAYGSADVSYSSDDYPQLNRYEDVEEHKTAESVRAAAKGNKVYDVARAAQKASKAASKARNAGNLLDSVKKMMASKTGAVGRGANNAFKNANQGKDIVGTSHSTIRPAQPEVKRSTVSAYIQEIKAGKSINPIEVVIDSEGNKIIVNGHHRYVAYKALGYADDAIPQKVSSDFTADKIRSVQQNWRNVRYVDDFSR